MKPVGVALTPLHTCSSLHGLHIACVIRDFPVLYEIRPFVVAS